MEDLEKGKKEEEDREGKRAEGNGLGTMTMYTTGA